MSNVYGLSIGSFYSLAKNSCSSTNSSYVTLDTSQTITGAKTFSGLTNFDTINATGGVSAPSFAVGTALDIGYFDQSTTFTEIVNTSYGGHTIFVNADSSGTNVVNLDVSATSFNSATDITIDAATLPTNENSHKVATTQWVKSVIPAPISLTTYQIYTTALVDSQQIFGGLTLPAGVKSALFVVTAAGGGSGACNSVACTNAAGGGPGSSCSFYFYPTSDMYNFTMAIYIGGGGSGGILPNGNGQPGYNTHVNMAFGSTSYYYNLQTVPGYVITANPGLGGLGGVGALGGAPGGSCTAGIPLFVNKVGTTGSPYNAVDAYQGNQYANFPYGCGGAGNNYTQNGRNGAPGAVEIFYTY